MRNVFLLFLTVLQFALIGCTIHPLPDDVTRKTTYDIVQQIRCEARRAIIDYADSRVIAAIAYEFDFNINEVNNGSVGATWAKPFVGGGLFSLTATAGANRTRDAVRNFKIADSFSEARGADCTNEALRKNWVYPIAGDIGMYEVVSTFLKLRNVENPDRGEVFSFADTLTFTTEISAGLKPTLTLNSVAGRFRLTEANANLSASRTDVHKVVVALKGATAVIARGKDGAPAIVGARQRLNFGRGAPLAGSNTVSLTLLQNEADVKAAALLELDRQRLLELQRTKDVIVLP